MPKFKPFTAEQRKAKTSADRERIKVITNNLLDKIEADETGAEADKFIQFTRNFWDYSFRNCVFIYSQTDGKASYVCGFKTWRKLQRWVRKGEKGIMIFAPIIVKEKDNAGIETGETKRFFRPVTVFDIAQTDGEPLDIDAQRKNVTMIGDVDPDQLLAALKDYCSEKDIEIKFDGQASMINSFSRGNSAREENKIAIFNTEERHTLSQAATLTHEIAHQILHKGKRELERETEEQQAEFATHTILKLCGVDVPSEVYLRNWKANRENIFDALKATEKLVKELSGYIEKKILA